MNISAQINSLNLSPSNKQLLKRFISSLRTGEISGSLNVAKSTAEFLRALLATCKWVTAKEIITLLHKIGKILTLAKPVEVCVGNIVRRILLFVRTVYMNLRHSGEGEAQEDAAVQLTPSLQDLLTANAEESYETPFRTLKSRVFEDIQELITVELGNTYESISNQALEYFHSKEVVMTYGHSNTVLKLFIEARKKSDFHVFVAETAPSNSGHLIAKKLAENGIETTLITDAAIFGIMSRVNKVFIGSYAVMANGGILSISGARLLAEAAKYHSVPFVVCGGLYKLTPVYPTHLMNLVDLHSPSQILPFEEVDRITRGNKYGVNVQNPSLDYVPPELVSLLLTNSGDHNPSYIYRLLWEYYNLEDYIFDETSELEDEL